MTLWTDQETIRLLSKIVQNMEEQNRILKKQLKLLSIVDDVSILKKDGKA